MSSSFTAIYLPSTARSSIRFKYLFGRIYASRKTKKYHQTGSTLMPCLSIRSNSNGSSALGCSVCVYLYVCRCIHMYIIIRRQAFYNLRFYKSFSFNLTQKVVRVRYSIYFIARRTFNSINLRFASHTNIRFG